MKKIRPTRHPFRTAIGFALPTFAQQTTADPQLRQQLPALAKKFEDAGNNNDAIVLAAFFTEDAVLIEDSGPIYGHEAIEKHYKDMFQNVHIPQRSSMEKFRLVGPH
jgi:uncharacterized protein (TIGR02246 family)